MATKPAFAPNAQVEHPKFGAGTILSCDEQYLVVNFDDHGDKKFVASIAVPHLKKLDREPPAKKTRARKRSTAKTKTPRKTAKTKKTAKAAS